MTIDFYYVPGSAPCRAVLLCAKAVGIDLNLKVTELMKGEHMTPEYIKLNPQHTVPTINDNGFCLWESRAIMAYFVNQYGKNDSLYPKDPKIRAVVDQRLYFDMGTLYQSFSECYYPVMFTGAAFDEAKKEKMNTSLGFLNTFLAKTEFAAANQLTIADLSLVATVTSIEAVGYDISPFEKVTKWLAKVKATAPGYEEANAKNCAHFKHLYETLTKNKK